MTTQPAAARQTWHGQFHFTKAGQYFYFCIYQAEMNGLMVVQ
jgi:plastocyanin